MSNPLTPQNVGYGLLSEDECIQRGIDFPGYERGAADAADILSQGFYTIGGKSRSQAERMLAAFSLMQSALREVVNVADGPGSWRHPDAWLPEETLALARKAIDESIRAETEVVGWMGKEIKDEFSCVLDEQAREMEV